MYYYGSGYNYAPYPTGGYGGWGSTWAVIVVIFLLLIIAGYWFNGNRGFGQCFCRCCNCQCGGC